MKPARTNPMILMLIASVPLLGGCSLEAAMSSCAQCGEIRSIAPRPVAPEIRLVTDAPMAAPDAPDRPGVPVVYDVRVHMDRGGSRDFVLARPPAVRVGGRVEVRDGALVPLQQVSLRDWT